VKLSEAVDLFLYDRKVRGCGFEAMKAYKQHCTLFASFLNDIGVIDISQLDARGIEKYLDSLRTRDQLRRDGKLSPVSIHKRMKHVRTFLLWLVRKGHVSKDVDLSFPMPKLKERLPKALSPEQVKALLTVKMSERDRAVLYLMLGSGLRRSEVTELTLDDLDALRGRVHVRHGKGDKERYALFGLATADCLRAWLAVRKSPGPFLFVDKWGRHLTVSGVYKIVKRVARSAGAKVNPHALRHTFGTEFLNAGGLATDLQLLMGHSHIETTLIYAKVALDRVQERFSELSVLEHLAGEK
jgi:site-specific recombinase XerD